MIGLRFHFDPVTRKRWRRYRARRRAWWSLWLLALLFSVSLAAELICNDRPLYMRLNGQSYFPVLRFYPADTFYRNGKMTRVNYKELARDAAFTNDPTRRIIWPIVPYGPYESIDPATLRPLATVTACFTPRPRVGNINVRPDLTIATATAAGAFFGRADADLAGVRLTDHWPLSAALKQAIEQRLRNEPAPPLAAMLRQPDNPAQPVEFALPAVTPRAAPPATLRLTLRETAANLPPPVRIEFADTNLHYAGTAADFFAHLPEPEQARVLTAARRAFTEAVYPFPLTLAGVEYEAAFARNDIRWPHPPVRGHWMGIDHAGRDVLARILYGLRTSMIFGFLLVAGTMALGVLIGGVQGYRGGWEDLAGQRLIEIWSALPFLYVMILLGSIYGRGFGLLLVCYGGFNWIGISYYMRAEFLRLRRLPFVDAARCLGIPARKIMWRHLLPNALTPLITFFPFLLVGAIGSLAALDYLGFGLPPPTPSWGELLAQAQQFRWAWWLILFPSAALFLVMLLGVLIGEGVRDAFDPQPFSRME